jgi:hypothetical protein
MTEFSANNFIMEIEKMHSGGMTYIECIASYCDRYGVELETAAKVIKKSPIAPKMEAECQELRMLKQTARLPL